MWASSWQRQRRVSIRKRMRHNLDILLVGLALGLAPLGVWLLAPLLPAALTGLWWLVSWFVGAPWVLLATATSLAGSGTLLALARRRRRRMAYTGQSAAMFAATSDQATQAANARVLADLAAQGHMVPGFTATSDPVTLARRALAGQGAVGATEDELCQSQGLRPRVVRGALRTLIRRGEVMVMQQRQVTRYVLRCTQGGCGE